MDKITKTTLKSEKKKFLKKLHSCFLREVVFQTSIVWDRKCFIWVCLGRNLKILWSYLESTTSNFSKCKFFNKNRNSLYLGLKCLIQVFLSKNFEKLKIWNQYPGIWKISKFHPEQKKSFKFRREFEKNFCHIWNQHFLIY